jgi:glycosyltransferase involved in cell wall biosynthesis
LNNDFNESLPKISILMSVYNTRPDWLQESINSILNQTYKNFELIIVNDGSDNKETNQMLLNYFNQYSIIKLVTLDKNIGLAAALNVGLKNCQYDLIFRFDSDDILYRDSLEKQIKYFVNLEKKEGESNVLILGCQLRAIKADTKEKIYTTAHPDFISNDNFLNLKKPSWFLNHGGVLIKKRVFLDKNIKGYNEEIGRAQDWDLWIRLLHQNYKIYNSNYVLYDFRIDNSAEKKEKNKNQNENKKDLDQFDLIKNLVKANKLHKKNFSSIPNTTIVTACFDLKNYYPEKSRNFARSIQEMVNENGEFLLEKLCYMTIFCDEFTYPEIFKVRNEKHQLGHLTKYHIIKFEDIWACRWKNKVIENTEKYWPTKTDRTEWPHHLINCNKFDFMLQSINNNFFETDYFVWCDFNIKKIFNDIRIKEKYDKKYSMEQRNLMFLNILKNLPDKFHVNIMGVVDKKYLNINLIKEYYQKYQWYVTGGFFSLKIKKENIEILNKLKERFVETTELGYGHGDEMLYFNILHENPDLFEKTYGDYSELIYNFHYPVDNHQYILNKIVKTNFNFHYYKECYEACEKCLKPFLQNEIDINYEYFLNFLFYKYASSFYCKRDEALQNALTLLFYVDEIPQLKIEFDKSKEFYMKQIAYVI